MAKGKKFDFRVVQDGTSWTAEIVRQVTSRKTAVSKSQTGFTSESDAQEWGEKELKVFLENLVERNKRRNAQREEVRAEAARREEVRNQQRAEALDEDDEDDVE